MYEFFFLYFSNPHFPLLPFLLVPMKGTSCSSLGWITLHTSPLDPPFSLSDPPLRGTWAWIPIS